MDFKEYFYKKAEKLKTQMEEYVKEDIDLFLKDFYALCHERYYKFENEEMPSGLDLLDAESILEALLEYKAKIYNTPVKDLKSISDKNDFWHVSDIFKMRPKRWGLYGDETLWEYLLFYFELFDVSIDLVSVEYVIENVMEIIKIYYKYAKHYEEGVVSEFWGIIDELCRNRYLFLCKEMDLLKS